MKYIVRYNDNLIYEGKEPMKMEYKDYDLKTARRIAKALAANEKTVLTWWSNGEPVKRYDHIRIISKNRKYRKDY